METKITIENPNEDIKNVKLVKETTETIEQVTREEYPTIEQLEEQLTSHRNSIIAEEQAIADIEAKIAEITKEYNKVK
jgi:Mg2+ and Co2+ transporter CorA